MLLTLLLELGIYVADLFLKRVGLRDDITDLASLRLQLLGELFSEFGELGLGVSLDRLLHGKRAPLKLVETRAGVSGKLHQLL